MGATDGNWDLVATERRALADLLAGLDAEQWQVQSLCPAWTVHGVAAHLVSALEASRRDMFSVIVAGRGSPPRMTAELAARWAGRTPGQLVAVLREHADSHFSPPGLGYRAPLTDLMVHRLDVAVPLGVEVDRPVSAWLPVLDFITSRMPMMGTFRGRRPAVAACATDVEWARGSGPAVSGPVSALGLTLAGRTALLHRLEGPGVATLKEWLNR